jgi:hypothetical protein
MKAYEFDKKFDDGESIISDLALSQAKREGKRTVNVNFPTQT